MPLLSFPWAWQLLWDELADAGFLSDKAAVASEIKNHTEAAWHECL